MPKEQSPREYSAKLNDFRRVRDDLSTYLLLMSAQFRESDLTVRDILGRTIAATALFDAIPKEIVGRCEISETVLSKDGIEQVGHFAKRISEAHRETLSAHPAWRTTRLSSPDRFTVDEICDTAAEAAEKFSALSVARDAMGTVGLSSTLPLSAVKQIIELLAAIPDRVAAPLLKNLLNERSRSSVIDLVERCTTFHGMKMALAPIFVSNLDAECLDALRRIAEICDQIDLPSIHHEDIRDHIAQNKRLLQLVRNLVTALTPLVMHRPESRAWKLRDVASAYAAVRAAGRPALSLRKDRLADRDPKSLVHICGEIRQLRNEKRELAEIFDVSVLLPPDVIAEYASVLLSAGLFSFLSPIYRKARRLYHSISRGSKFSKNEAARSLDRLARFLKRQVVFESDPLPRAIFGGRFRGLDTEFEPFEALGKFYISVEEIESASLRQFLREGSLSDLEWLPEIPLPAAGDLTYDLLAPKAAQLEGEIASLTEAAEALQPLTPIFSDARAVSPARVRDLTDNLRRTIEQADLLENHEAAGILGPDCSGARADVALLRQLVAWSGSAIVHSEHLHSILDSDLVDEARAHATAVVGLEETTTVLVAELALRAKIDKALLVDRFSLSKTAEQMLEAGRDAEGLFGCASFKTLAEPLDNLGFRPLREYLASQKGCLDNLGALCEALILRRLARSVLDDHAGRLGAFSGAHLNGLRRSVADLDRELIALARKDLRARIEGTANPPWGNGQGRRSTYTEMALIENEIGKTQRFIPVRDLTQRAGKALLELKPCWMMSPLAVAQYVPRNIIKFDLCIIDEASQMPPESALGALLRCRQTVVVGDTNQLPPSSFFRTSSTTRTATKTKPS